MIKSQNLIILSLNLLKIRGDLMKYGNKKVIVDGLKFDSRKEANRYCELKLLERAGQITNLRIQQTFELIPAYYENYERYSKTGKRLTDGRRRVERAVCYKADFVYKENGKRAY